MGSQVEKEEDKEIKMTQKQLEKLEDFKNKNDPKSPVYSHREEIHNLRHSGYSIDQIKKYLRDTYSLKTSDRTISRVLSQQVFNTAEVPQAEAKDETEVETDPKKKAAQFFTQKTIKEL
jgi:DNA-binding transcriptional MerR regulator